MSRSTTEAAGDAPVTVYRQYDDGYIVRSMTREDASVVAQWFTGMGIVSNFDLNITLSVFPASLHGFYIGEFQGKVVASSVSLPWGDDICYGAFYYVDEPYRRRGFGTRLRDEVAREHVGTKTLCIDSVTGTVADNNKQKFGYQEVFKTGRFQCTAKSSYASSGLPVTILPVSMVDFNKLIDYDNKCFVSQNFAPRRDFLQLWTQIPGGAAYVAVSDVDGGQIIGYGCRRPAIQASNHEVGPLYADDASIAEALLNKLCSEVADGDNITIQIWYHNEESLALMPKFGFNHVFDLLHMHLNEDPHHEQKRVVFAVTSIDVCGF